jgi:hypothetical protein
VLDNKEDSRDRHPQPDGICRKSLNRLPSPQPLQSRLQGRSLVNSSGPNKFMRKRIQIDSYHEQYPQAIAISNTVRDVLKVLSGTLTSTTVQGTILGDDKDLPAESGESGYVFRHMLEVDVWFQEN